MTSTYAAQDKRPTWEPRPYSQGQADLIKVMMAERNISTADLLAVFPTRPSNFAEGGKVIEWVKAQPKPMASPVPTSPQALTFPKDKHGKPIAQRYAVEMDGVLKFYRVKPGYKPGFYFIDVQASDDLHAIKNYGAKTAIIAAISEDPEGALRRYGQELGVCGRCGRTLTDEVSRANGIGPVCIEK